ncbi:MAG: hypothetical protein OSB05_16415, partial [Akkermansiaceae bacterium]|nr:hypothetical protein [Akkermansiaceae bacterium]
IDERGAVQAGAVRFGLLQSITARLSQTFTELNAKKSNIFPLFRLTRIQHIFRIHSCQQRNWQLTDC